MTNESSKPVFGSGRDDFNPAAKMFGQIEKGAAMSAEVLEMKVGGVHTTGMFDEESDAHGGAAVDESTGKANTNSVVTSTSGLSTVDEDYLSGEKSKKPVSEMSLEELIASQSDDM